MKRKKLKNIATVTGWLLASTLLMQFVWSASGSAKAATPDRQSERVNLALRRTAHQLLRAAGDSTSRIPAVEQVGEQSWRLRLAHNLNYNSLPALLQAALELHNIHTPYDVAVLDCTGSTLQLGYHIEDLAQPNAPPMTDVPCTGRELSSDCYYIKLTLLAGSQPNSPMPLMGWFFSAAMALGLYAIGRRPLKPAAGAALVSNPEPAPTLAFGQCSLDVPNQRLSCCSSLHELTFREAKLLHLFAQHPNQVLDRSFIMANVWADEGVLVGRSLDMFVSRLRKMLRNDPSIQLVAVHGVGYRMEVND
jgi:hypothetical protein